MVQKAPEEEQKDQRVLSRPPCHPPICFKAVYHLSTTATIPQTVPQALPLHHSQHPQHSLDWLRHRYWSSWKEKAISSGYKLHVSKMRIHHLSRIIMWAVELSVGHCDRGTPKKLLNDCLITSVIVTACPILV